MGHFPVKRVYNWIDTAVFKPRDAKKSDFNLDENKFTIICAGADWNTRNVKTNDLLFLADKLSDDYQILLVGRADESINHPRIVKTGFVSDTKILSEMYSVGDAYVHLSTADTFGKVIAEAMACGTPAIVYNVTACPELIGEGCGAAVALHDIDAIVKELEKIKANGREFYSHKCIDNVLNNFSYKKCVEQTLEIYNEMLK
jgi:glycosyltransferase involved in cell wall biosynthesis